MARKDRKTLRRALKQRKAIGLRVPAPGLRRPGVQTRTLAGKGTLIGVSQRELKPLPQYFFKKAPPLPPPANKLTPTGYRYIKHGKIERNVLPRDSRLISGFASGFQRQFNSGRSLF